MKEPDFYFLKTVMHVLSNSDNNYRKLEHKKPTNNEMMCF